MRILKATLCVLALFAAASGIAEPQDDAPQQDMAQQAFAVGEVYYFGYGGIDPGQAAGADAALPRRPFIFATFDRARIDAAVARASRASRLRT